MIYKNTYIILYNNNKTFLNVYILKSITIFKNNLKKIYSQKHIHANISEA